MKNQTKLFIILISLFVVVLSFGIVYFLKFYRPPSITIQREECDVDNDNDCDNNDVITFKKFIGECEEGNNFNVYADADHDGCITFADQKKLFSEQTNFEAIYDLSVKQGSDVDNTCKSKCEIAAGKQCYDLFEICLQGGASDLFGCNEYVDQHPEIFNQYPCTYNIGQSIEGFDSVPCSFSCK